MHLTYIYSLKEFGAQDNQGGEKQVSAIDIQYLEGSLTSISKSREPLITVLTQGPKHPDSSASSERRQDELTFAHDLLNLICSSCSSRERRTSCREFSPCWLSSSTGDTIWRWCPLSFLFPFLKRKIWLSWELPNQHKKMGLLSSYLCLQLVLV